MEGYKKRHHFEDDEDAEFLEGKKENIEYEEGEWCFEKIDGKWQSVLLRDLGYFDPSTYPEKRRRMENFQLMMMETGAQWKLNDETAPHNEGFLRDHPQYHELFSKWAMRYLRKKGLDKNKFCGRVEESEGNLLNADGRWSKTWLVNAVANQRELIDEKIEMELRISEGFVDITNDYDRREKLGIEPEHDGWWTQDEI